MKVKPPEARQTFFALELERRSPERNLPSGCTDLPSGMPTPSTILEERPVVWSGEL